ncbi:MAG: TatD family hydrolase [Clostridiales bacterium]|jgi:TatD DNase family protein|nr:TatD family hydrolase [Clostridiales bacterium]
MLIDTHCHYDDEKYDADRDDILSKVHNKGVKILINCGVDLPGTEKSLKLAEKYNYIYFTAGIHPENLLNVEPGDIDKIREYTKQKKCVGIGETGLDYHNEVVSRKAQKDNFVKHIALAREVKLPIVVHDRDAHEDTLEILKNERVWECGGVMHCFSGSVEMAKKVIDMGMYISIGGVVTFKNAKKAVDVIKYVPVERLMLETDCPYMAPEPVRGSRNDSSNLVYIAQKIAEIKGWEYMDICDATSTTVFQFFTKIIV